MRYQRVLLVSPSYPGGYFGGVRPPVGLGYVEEFIAARGVTTDALDMSLGYGRGGLFRKVRRFAPQLIGFSLMTYQYLHTFSLIKEVKTRFPTTEIVVGGPHVSALEGEVLGQSTEIDYAISGEGELPMLELCLGRPLHEIRGLYHRVGGAVRCGGPRQYVSDLDQLPFPRFSSYPLDRYTNEIEIITSRGCPHKCIFCAVPNIMGRRIRFRSARRVGDELEYFYRRGVRSFQIGDDNFLANSRRVSDLLAEIDSRKLKGAVFRCGQGIRADLINHDNLSAMKRVGFKQLGIGVESGSDRVLQTICKHLTVDEADRAIALACEMGFDVTLLFVMGAPGETLDDVRQSIRLAEKHPVMKAFFFNLIPFPGTALNTWVSDRNLMLGSEVQVFNRRDEWKLRSRPFFETPEMSEADRIEAQRLTEAVSKQIMVHTLQRKMSGWGLMGRLAAEAGRFDFFERLFVRHRRFRRILDRVVFGTAK